jgi:predicted MFS family arabinose efflux permease
MGRSKAIRQVLAIRNYRYYLAGNLVSTSGNWVQRVAMAWLTWDLTQSAAWLGMIAFADMFPTFVIGLFAGTLLDRTDSLKVMRLTQLLSLVQAASLTLLVFSGHATMTWLLFFALVRGIIIAFNRPARMTTIYYIAGREHLSSVIAINSMVFNSSRFIGPAIGGVLTAAGGVGWAFFYNALTYLFFYLALLAIRIPPAKVEQPKRRGLLAETLEGLRYARGATGISFLLIVILLNSLFVRPFTDLLPGFADAVFGRGAAAYSAMLTLHGISAMLGGYWLAQRGGVNGFTRIMVRSLLVLAVALLLFTATRNYWLALPLMVVSGGAFVIQGIAIQTLMQTSCAPEMRGRVMGLYGVVARGGPAAGALIMGWLSEYFGLRAPVAGGAVLCLFLWLWARSRQRAMSTALEREPGDLSVPAVPQGNTGSTGTQ